MIGSDFEWHEYQRTKRCSECGKEGRRMLVSRKDGKVRKIVCSEECRQEFDARYWEHRALERRLQESRRVKAAEKRFAKKPTLEKIEEIGKARNAVIEDWEKIG